MDESAAVWVDITSLKPWDRNPRINDPAVDNVARSIKRFGFGAPIVARQADGEIIAGHTRLKAAIKLGLPKVPVRYVDLDPVDSHLLALADNKTNELSSWDDGLLGGIFAEMQAADIDLSDTGFTEDEIATLVGDEEPEPEDTIPEPSEDLRAKWNVELGQIWVAGNHRVMCGDCRNQSAVDLLMDGKKINVAFTSPPYAAQRTYDKDSGFVPIPPDEYVDWFKAVQANVRAHLAADGSWFVNIKEHCESGQRVLYVKDLTLAHARLWNWMFVDEFCWLRSGVPGGWPNRFKNGWEPVFHYSTQPTIKFRHEAVGHRSGGAFDYSPDNGKSASGSGLLGERATGFHEGMARPSNALDIPSAGVVTGSHPAEFPVGLPEFFVKAFSDEGDIVYDPFLGSGTTLVAAEHTRRRGYGMELSPIYVAVVLERLAGLGLSPKQGGKYAEVLAHHVGTV